MLYVYLLFANLVACTAVCICTYACRYMYNYISHHLSQFFVILQTKNLYFLCACIRTYVHSSVNAYSCLYSNADAAFKYFVEPLSISDAYLRMIAELNSILKHCDLSDLQSVLIHQVNTPKGIQLKEVLKEKIRNKIEAATSSFYLISILADFPFCNWLDTRLVEALAIGSRLKSSSDLVNAYKKFLFQKKFRDALLEFPTVQEEEIEAYVIAVSEKIHVDPDKITIGDFLKKRRTMEHAILDLMNQTLCIQNVRKGCVEFSYYIQENCSLRAYKMALHNRYKFYTVNLIHIKIEEHPVIYDPWLPDFDKEIAKQSLYAQYEGT